MYNKGDLNFKFVCFVLFYSIVYMHWLTCSWDISCLCGITYLHGIACFCGITHFMVFFACVISLISMVLLACVISFTYMVLHACVVTYLHGIACLCGITYLHDIACLCDIMYLHGIACFCCITYLLLKRLKEILGKEKGELLNLKYVDRGKVKRDTAEVNRIGKYIEDITCVCNVTQATTVLAGELLEMKESKKKVEKEPKIRITNDIERSRKDLSKIEDWFKGNGGMWKKVRKKNLTGSTNWKQSDSTLWGGDEAENTSKVIQDKNIQQPNKVVYT